MADEVANATQARGELWRGEVTLLTPSERKTFIDKDASRSVFPSTYFLRQDNGLKHLKATGDLNGRTLNDGFKEEFEVNSEHFVNKLTIGILKQPEASPSPPIYYSQRVRSLTIDIQGFHADVMRSDGKPSPQPHHFLFDAGDGTYEEHTFIDENDAKCVMYITLLGTYTSVEDIDKLIKRDQRGRQ